ncbi:ribonuclease P protein subunit p30-like [Actinia tenebrosa]|uniref:Ribonuclease P protein subunit p30-like n=1 Tax=Actinia tenebrosa TaxID=6105 RepID=A0A6P8HYV4_ACTTE|nr:ribonuclease P protein subunit p30-like [Actinia tenebrosa]
MAAFGDLCIVHQNDSRETEILISKAVKLGYETIAISSTFLLTNNKKTKLKTSCPPPINWNEIPAVKTLKAKNKNLKILSRLTVPLEENSQMHQLATDTVLSYDILAVRPASDKLFQQCCGSLDVDIISIDMTSRLPFYIKLPQVKQAIERGIHFEIVYSPAIRDNTQRRYIMSNAMELVRASKGRNVIMSSEAENQIDLRGAYDVANLGMLFGLKEEQCKAAVSRNVRAVLYHAQARRSTEKSTIGGCLISSVKSGLQKMGKKREMENEREGVDCNESLITSGKRNRNEEEIPPKKKQKSLK